MSQSRKFVIVVNNPKDHGLDQDLLHKKLEALKSFQYCCSELEIGLETGTEHIQAFVQYDNPKQEKTIRNALGGEVWVKAARGSAKQNRDYCFKIGKWENDKKAGTRVEGTQKESGSLPEDVDADFGYKRLFKLIEDGWTTFEIISQFPEHMKDATLIDRVRKEINKNLYRETFRNIEITYIWGSTRLGKSRFVMENHGYSEVYRVTNPKNPWDAYDEEDVVAFEEFASSYKIQEMNIWLDGYPCVLPARYSDKVATFTKAYIISNLPLKDQYKNEQEYQPDVYKAFVARIKTFVHFLKEDYIKVYFSYEDLRDDVFVVVRSRKELGILLKNKDRSIDDVVKDMQSKETVNIGEIFPDIKKQGGA